jgi:hypothetical protein
MKIYPTSFSAEMEFRKIGPWSLELSRLDVRIVSTLDPFLWNGSSFGPRAALPRHPTGMAALEKISANISLELHDIYSFL